MSIEIKMIKDATSWCCLNVVGVGGGGNSAIWKMIDVGLEGVKFNTIDTNIHVPEMHYTKTPSHIGQDAYKRLKTGSNAKIGLNAVLENQKKIKELLSGSDAVFVVAGLGGSFGTEAMPVVTEAAKEVGALTVAVVSTPFGCEGKRRMDQAIQGVGKLKKVADCLILIPNTRLCSVLPKKASFTELLKTADNIMCETVRAISDLIVKPGLIGLDVADVHMVMSKMGLAMVGIGQTGGNNRVIRAMEAAVKSPLLNEFFINGARNVLINITAPMNITMDELGDASCHMREIAHVDANIIWGCITDETMGKEVRVTIIANGIGVDKLGDTLVWSPPAGVCAFVV